MSPVLIREINSSSNDEISWVAERMRATLIDVLGRNIGEGLYSMDWLNERVRWHIDSKKTTGKVFISENPEQEKTGQAIARLEHRDGERYGYFATLYVEPNFRRQGIAAQLMLQVERWFKKLKMSKIVYNTAKSNDRLISLFKRQGYRITLEHKDMIQLTKYI
ncbi:MAG: GNAT family N-acetyltransferase [Bdellovibrionales bacterium]|nr:GNAT family N-acetyltransferase [Bdellovibrionales bacterium]